MLLLYHPPFHYAVQTARTNQSDKINISTIYFLVTQGLSWF